jgi:chromate reductase
LIDQLEIPSSVIQLKKIAKMSHLLLFVTPEYNSSVAPAVKNAYDWLSRPDPEFDNKSVIGGKCAAVISTSYIGQTQSQDCEKMGEYWKLRYFSKPYYLNLGSGAFDEKGHVKSEAEKKKIVEWGGELIKWVTQNK